MQWEVVCRRIAAGRDIVIVGRIVRRMMYEYEKYGRKCDKGDYYYRIERNRVYVFDNYLVGGSIEKKRVESRIEW